MRAPRPAVAVGLGLAALGLVAAVIALTLGGNAPRRLVPGAGNTDATFDPLAYTDARAGDFSRRAAAGEAHPLYAQSPGGAVATARRTARWRAPVELAARDAGVDPDLVEAIVFLESAGRPDAMAGPTPSSAAGLTQILGETGRDLLGLRVDEAASGRITRRLARAQRRHRTTLVTRLAAQRLRVDERFDPVKALQATGRYLKLARAKLSGRADLAVESYHMGIGNLQGALAAYGAGNVPYVRLYFDSAPLRHAGAYTRLATLGDDSATYWWRILAARDVMRAYRRDPAGLARTAARQTARNSAEEVLHPLGAPPVFSAPGDVARARRGGALRPLPARSAASGLAVDPHMGELAPRLGQRPALYRALRPDALAVLRYLGAGVRGIGGARAPIVVSSAVRDTAYQRLLAARNIEATHTYSLHTTGFAFDVLRRYSTRRQALAFQFLLDRLQALDLIAWLREPAAIHVTVAGGAARLLGND